MTPKKRTRFELIVNPLVREMLRKKEIELNYWKDYAHVLEERISYLEIDKEQLKYCILYLAPDLLVDNIQ